MVAVVGRTNSGKSTLVNRLVGEKVSIVSGMEQTTRNRIRAIVTEARGQLVFLDTPGAHKAENELGTLMNRMARGAGRDADVLLVVFDGAAPVRLEDEGWMARAAFAGCPVVFALNKADAPGFAPGRFREAWARVRAEKAAERGIALGGRKALSVVSGILLPLSFLNIVSLSLLQKDVNKFYAAEESQAAAEELPESKNEAAV